MQNHLRPTISALRGAQNATASSFAKSWAGSFTSCKLRFFRAVRLEIDGLDRFIKAFYQLLQNGTDDNSRLLEIYDSFMKEK